MINFLLGCTLGLIVGFFFGVRASRFLLFAAKEKLQDAKLLAQTSRGFQESASALAGTMKDLSKEIRESK